jgi:hypothetical protein
MSKKSKAKSRKAAKPPRPRTALDPATGALKLDDWDTALAPALTRPFSHCRSARRCAISSSTSHGIPGSLPTAKSAGARSSSACSMKASGSTWCSCSCRIAATAPPGRTSRRKRRRRARRALALAAQPARERRHPLTGRRRAPVCVGIGRSLLRPAQRRVLDRDQLRQG